MVSDATLDRFYYIFDSREQRALVLDRTTGEEMAWQSVPRVQLIDHVGRQKADAPQQDASIHRQFAGWCARRVGVPSAPAQTPTARLWRAVQASDAEARQAARAEALDAVVRAAALGLSRRRSDAARLLVVHACTHPDARRAAIDAAHMSERWAEFRAEDDPEGAVRALRQRQVDWLLDALNET